MINTFMQAMVVCVSVYLNRVNREFGPQKYNTCSLESLKIKELK